MWLPAQLIERGKDNAEKIGMMLGCLLLAALVGVALAQQNQPYYPVGSISLESTSIAAGIGGSWGNGWMIFQGQQYPISVSREKAAEFGTSDEALKAELEQGGGRARLKDLLLAENVLGYLLENLRKQSDNLKGGNYNETP